MRRITSSHGYCTQGKQAIQYLDQIHGTGNGDWESMKVEGRLETRSDQTVKAQKP